MAKVAQKPNTHRHIASAIGVVALAAAGASARLAGVERVGVVDGCATGFEALP